MVGGHEDDRAVGMLRAPVSQVLLRNRSEWKEGEENVGCSSVNFIFTLALVLYQRVRMLLFQRLGFPFPRLLFPPSTLPPPLPPSLPAYRCQDPRQRPRHLLDKAWPSFPNPIAHLALWPSLLAFGRQPHVLPAVLPAGRRAQL